MSSFVWVLSIFGAVPLALFATASCVALFWPNANRRAEAKDVMTRISEFIVTMTMTMSELVVALAKSLSR